MNFKVAGLVLWIAVGAGLFMVYRSKNQLAEEQAKSPTQADAAGDADGDASTPTVTISAPPMELKDFELTNVHTGETVRKEDIVGKPTVLLFVFSRCIETCRPMTLQMRNLHNKVTDPNIQFICVTVDPDYDTVEMFKKYADVYEPDTNRWIFLTGEKEMIYSMVRDGFKLPVAEMFGKDRRPGYEVSHTEKVVLLNGDGVPVETYAILKDVERVKLLRVLEGKKPMPKPREKQTVTIQYSDGEVEEITAKGDN